MSWTFNVHAQTNIIESIKSKIHAASSSQARLKFILDLCEQHHSLNRDTLEFYAQEATQLSSKNGNTSDRTLAAIALANSYYRWGWMDSALATINTVERSLDVTKPADRYLYYKAERVKAICFGGRSDFKSALDILYPLVEYAERYRDSAIVGANMNTIGSISVARDEVSEAWQWFYKALAYSPSSHAFDMNRAAIFVNMANAFSAAGNNDSAQYYIQRGLALGRKVENLNTVASALRVQSNIFRGIKNIDSAGVALKEMIQVRKLTNNDSSMFVDDNLLLINFYIENGQVDKAISFCNDLLIQGNLYDTDTRGKTLANIIGSRLVYYEALARCYQLTGDDTKYQQMLLQIINAKDTIYEINSADAIAEMKTKYEVQKKETTIIQQQLDITRKNYLFYGSLIFLSIAIIFSLLLFKNYRRKQHLKMQLAVMEEKKLSEGAVKGAEENERKRIAADLHDNLGAYAASIASNLDHLSVPMTSQNAVPLQELRNNSRAIVSQLSDTIWALKKDALSLTAISDRVKLFIQRIRPSYPSITMDVKENILHDLVLAPSHAFHLFRIIQEAVNNSLKHARCTLVEVCIDGNDQWHIAINDNGTGFDHGIFETTQSNGLSNMRSRAATEGWRIDWINKIPGTSVIIEPK